MGVFFTKKTKKSIYRVCVYNTYTYMHIYISVKNISIKFFLIYFAWQNISGDRTNIRSKLEDTSRTRRKNRVSPKKGMEVLEQEGAQYARAQALKPASRGSKLVLQLILCVTLGN